MLARGWHAVIAALVAVALIVQIIVAVRLPSSPPTTATGFVQGTGVVGRLIRIVSFFTIESNVLSGLVSLQLALRPDRDGPIWRAVRLAALFGIAVTGIVYSTVLATIHQPKAGAETLVNTLVHYIVPILMVIGWLAFGPRPRVGWRTVGWSLLFSDLIPRLHPGSRRDLALVPVSVPRRNDTRLRARGTQFSCGHCTVHRYSGADRVVRPGPADRSP